MHRVVTIILAKLYAELEWSSLVGKFSLEPKSISIDPAKEMREYFKTVEGKDLTLDDTNQLAKDLLTQAIPAEKERLASEIKMIVNKYI